MIYREHIFDFRYLCNVNHQNIMIDQMQVVCRAERESRVVQKFLCCECKFNRCLVSLQSSSS